MTGVFGRLFAVALNTFREAIRNRVLYVLVAFAVGLMAFSLVLGELSMHEEVRVIKDLGLAGLSIVGLVIALFLGVNLLSKELDRKTVYFVIPKPLERWEFLLGKYLGMAVTLGLLVVLMASVLAAFIVANGGHYDMVLVRAQVLVLGELWLVSAVAMLFSAFSSPYLSAIFTAGFWLIGRNAQELRVLAETKLADSPLGQVLAVIANFIPNFDTFYVSGANVGGELASIHGSFVDWNYVVSTMVYGILYGSVCLLGATSLFAKRDLT